MRSLTCAREAFGSTRTEKHRMIARFIGFLFLSFLSSTLTGNGWSDVADLLPGPPQVIGSYAAGCIAGASGAGKSTLPRTLAGVWPYARGTVYLPDAEVLFVPQRPYLPIGTLRDALLYPQRVPLDDALLRQTLRDVGLGRFADTLDPVEDWAQTLSGGEQQRVAFTRILLR